LLLCCFGSAHFDEDIPMTTSKSLCILGLALSCAAITLSLAIYAQAQTVTQFNLDGQNGYVPYTTVTQATDGNFYGTTGLSGPKASGNIFRLTPTGEITNLYYFCSLPNCVDGQGTQWPPILASDGNLYGVTTVKSKNTLYRLTVAGEFTTLFSFCTQECPGSIGITLASDGNFYGTSSAGGVKNNGTIFRVSLTGEYTVLHTFCSLKNCTDGMYSLFPPIQGIDGNFYGTTYEGGSQQAGVVYKLTPSGEYTVIHDFCAYGDNSCPGGTFPANIVQDAQGNLVGATQCGGINHNGVVFKITPTGQYSVLYDFSSASASIGWSSVGLTLASDGNFYGVLGGGPPGSWDPNVAGAVYRITPEGVFTPLYSFCERGECAFNPLAPVIQATDGSLYGTTAFGGNPSSGYYDFPGYGAAFQLSTGLGPLVTTTPVAGPVGQSVVILGNNLSGTTSVTFNGVAAEFTVESDTYIRATVPAGASSGMVSVDTPAGTLKSNPQFVVTK
jgi:uncharacterized repeat protein (TIGR03803 family)